MILGFDCLLSWLCHPLHLTDTITQYWTGSNMFTFKTEYVQICFCHDNNPSCQYSISITHSLLQFPFRCIWPIKDRLRRRHENWIHAERRFAIGWSSASEWCGNSARLWRIWKRTRSYVQQGLTWKVCKMLAGNASVEHSNCSPLMNLYYVIIIRARPRINRKPFNIFF